MSSQKELRIVNIENIMVNPENPRHEVVQLSLIDMGEDIIMEELIQDRASAKKMFDLINSIYDSGFIPSLAVILEYKEDLKKYIPWDGNRRVTALKLLKNPSIMQRLKYFTIPEINTIFQLSKKVQPDFFEVTAYIVQNFEEAAPMIKAIHTTASGAMQWDRKMIKRFEQKLGIKNVLTQAESIMPNVFKDLPNNFPTSVLDKILESKEGKKYLNIDNLNNELTFTSSIDETEQKLKKIVDDIKNGNINSKTVQNNKKIREYLTGEDSVKQVDKEKTEDNKADNNIVNDVIEKSKENTEKLKADNENKNKQEQLSFSSENDENNYSTSSIKKDNLIAFSNINIDKLDYSNKRAQGIRALASEIQRASRSSGNKYYPISYCFLLRALLEQTSIYFLMNKEKWEKLVNGKNRDLYLGEIIVYITRNLENLILDDTIKRAWNTVFDNLTNKDYLDLVIHHPYMITANIDYIKIISDMGLFAIIQYFIDSK